MNLQLESVLKYRKQKIRRKMMSLHRFYWMKKAKKETKKLKVVVAMILKTNGPSRMTMTMSMSTKYNPVKKKWQQSFTLDLMQKKSMFTFHWWKKGLITWSTVRGICCYRVIDLHWLEGNRVDQIVWDRFRSSNQVDFRNQIMKA